MDDDPTYSIVSILTLLHPERPKLSFGSSECNRVMHYGPFMYGKCSIISNPSISAYHIILL